MNYIFWIVFIVVMLVIEASTVNLITIWFATGALAAIIAGLLGANQVWQIAVMLVVSAAALLIARPFIKKHHSTGTVATNADMLIGQTAIVTEAITNGKFAGSVTVNGKTWSATTDDGTEIAEGAKVIIRSISGVRLIVAETANSKAGC